MNLKKLDQSVFEGLPKEYRWAAVDIDGAAFASTCKMTPEDPFLSWRESGLKVIMLGTKYDATDFQNSLIERQDVPTADIDWGRQEVPAGATHFMRHPTALSFYRSGDDGFEGYHSKKREWYFLQNTGEFFHKNLLEIPPKPEPQVDWSKAPEGATHYYEGARLWYKKTHDEWFVSGKKGNGWERSESIGTDDDDLKESELIKRPESITDVARTIEAARVAEKSTPFPDGDVRYFETSDVPETKKYPHYFKDVSAVDAIDLYHVAKLYEITDPALFHAFKKIACAGKRGAKDRAQDVQEAIDALKRWQELSA